jgi:hypothetical protein
MSRLAATLGMALLVAACLAGCATPTPYQPNPRFAAQGNAASLSHATAGGYSELKLEPNRILVNFSGNSLTPRETVEGYLLYRAAELTLQNGDDWFSIVVRNTDRKDRAYIEPNFYGPGFGYGRWGGYGYGWGWGGYGWSGYGWGGWGGWGPYWGGADIWTTQSYSASAEIITHKGVKPADQPLAFDAHAVVENLRPKIKYPPVKSG